MMERKRDRWWVSEGDVNESRKTSNLIPKAPEKIAENEKQINSPEHATLN